MSRVRLTAIVALALLAVAVAGIAVWRVLRPAPAQIRVAGDPVAEPVVTAAAYMALAENPGAKRAMAFGPAAKAVTNCFAHAGLECFGSEAEGKFDLVFVDCVDADAQVLKDAFFDRLSDDGVMAWFMDVNKTTAAEFRDRLARFPCPAAHLWMPGSANWLVVGRRKARCVPLEGMIDLFVREEAFADLAKAELCGLPQLFAGYVGAIEDVLPAFAEGDLTARVRPEFFLTKEIPEIDWIDDGETDADIRDRIRREMRSMQVVRRLVVESAIQDPSERPEASVDRLMRAARRNPHDTFILERLGRLERNAEVFLKVNNIAAAAKCYEIVVIVRPDDVAAIRRLGECYRRQGHAELSEQVLKRAKEVEDAKGK